jgi:hypothetical protein
MTILDATVSFRYSFKPLASSLRHSLEPDNKSLENLNIRSHQSNGTIFFKIDNIKSPAQLLSTIDDLLICLQAGEKSLKLINK